MTFARLDIARVGDDTVRIAGAEAASRVGNELVDWLRARSEVVAIEWRDRSGALEVRYRDPDGSPGGFVRSLEDQVFALQRPPPPPFSVTISHRVPGRARFAFTGTFGDDLARCAAWLSSQPGVLRASASPATESVLVLFDAATTRSDALLSALRATTSDDWPAPARMPEGPGWGTAVFNTAVLAASVTGAVPLPAMAAGVAVTAIPPVRRAARALREGRVSVDLLDVAAIGISVATGQPATAAFITWLLGVGDMLLAHSADRARAAISRLMDLDVPEAFRLRGNETERVRADRLRPDDLVVVDGGRRIPADGVVVSGLAMVDEKALTGESEPRERSPGSTVLAATVVVEGHIVVRVDRIGTDTTAAKIVKILEGAGGKPMTLQRDAERIADRLVLPTFGVAGTAAALTSTIDRATSVLITDFGTGIRIAVPANALTAMTLAARQGVLVKGSQYLERLSKADIVVFDKTGTLTGGMPEIVDVAVFEGHSVDEVVALCAGAELRQSHPIAEAILRHATRIGVVPREAEIGSEQYTLGLGLTARVDGRVIRIGSVRFMKQHGIDTSAASAQVERHAARAISSLWVAVGERLVAVLGYSDQPRSESVAVVRALRAGGRRRVVLLSGDAPGPVANVAAAVGVDEARGELLPEDKASWVREMQKQGHVVAMVGDGINDAPALATADVGISLHGGTDVALETADVVLLEGGLSRLSHAFDVADAAMRRVRFGLGLVIVPNAAAVVLGALGLLNPALAAVVNNGTTVVSALAALSPLVTTRKLPPRSPGP